MKNTPFTFINAICNHEYVEVDSTYNQFLVNRFFSYFVDTVLISNEASKFTGISNQAHFDFYYHLISRKKRFVKKWYKSDNEDIKIIANYYDISYKNARIYLGILLNEEIALMKQSLENNG